MEQVVWVLVWLAILVVCAYVAHLVIVKFFPAELHIPVLLIVGVLLLVLLIVWVLGWPPIRPRIMP
jgi:hypothetical protein